MYDIFVTLITVFYVIICILMILIILLQAGRGGMGTALGGGASQSVFGGGGSSDVLAKITQGCAAGFMIFAMFLAYASAHSGSANLKAKSEENAVEERTAGEDDVVDYERIGPNPMRLPPRRDPNMPGTNSVTPPNDPAVDPTPADAPVDPAVDPAVDPTPADVAADPKPADPKPADVVPAEPKPAKPAAAKKKPNRPVPAEPELLEAPAP